MNQIQWRAMQIAVVVAAICLAFGTILTTIPITPSLSLNGILTLSSCAVVCTYAVILGGKSRYATTVLALVVLIGGCRAIQNGAAITSLLYVGLLGTFIVSALVTIETRTFLKIFVPTCLFCLVIVLPLSVINFDLFGRAEFLVFPLCVLLLLSLKRFLGQGMRRIVLLLAGLTLVLITAQNSRMASALCLLVIVIHAVFFSNMKAWLRVATSIAMSVAYLSYWLWLPSAHTRMFGNDASLAVGPVTLNGEGRSAAIRALSLPSLDDPVTLAIGRGGGSATTELANVSFPLETPHNEYLRLLIDYGAVAMFAFILLLVGLLILGLRLRWKAGPIPASEVLVGAPILVAGFSLTDNPLSYSWFLIPCGIAIGWSLTAQRDSLMRRLTGVV